MIVPKHIAFLREQERLCSVALRAAEYDASHLSFDCSIHRLNRRVQKIRAELYRLGDRTDTAINDAAWAGNAWAQAEIYEELRQEFGDG